MPKGKGGKKKGGKKGKKSKNARPTYMSEELWKLVNNMGDLLLNFQGKPSQSCSISLNRAKAAFYLWQLALRGRKKRQELLQQNVLQAALQSIETPPIDDDVQVRTSTIGLITSLCVEATARTTLMGYKNAVAVTHLMNNLSHCTPW